MTDLKEKNTHTLSEGGGGLALEGRLVAGFNRRKGSHKINSFFVSLISASLGILFRIIFEWKHKPLIRIKFDFFILII